MLRELPNTKQIEGEAPRKWFFCHEQDLVVWFDESGRPCAFQLAYDKYFDEHSIAWRADVGLRHYLIDDGDSMGRGFETPFMYADGPFPRERVLARFLDLSLELPASIVSLVAEKLRAFDGPIGDAVVIDATTRRER